MPSKRKQKGEDEQPPPKKKQVALPSKFIIAGKFDKYKGVNVLLDDSIYEGKVPDNAKGKNFLYSVYSVAEKKNGDPTFVLITVIFSKAWATSSLANWRPTSQQRLTVSLCLARLDTCHNQIAAGPLQRLLSDWCRPNIVCHASIVTRRKWKRSSWKGERINLGVKRRIGTTSSFRISRKMSICSRIRHTPWCLMRLL